MIYKYSLPFEYRIRKLRYKISLVFICLILIGSNLQAQQQNFFQFSQINANQIDSVEVGMQGHLKELSYKIGVSSDYFPNASTFKLAQPKVFSRPATGQFIGCQVNYFFTAPDSVVRLIDYTWDTKNDVTSLTDLLKKENDQSGSKTKYDSEFQKIAAILTDNLGKPVEGTGEFVKKQEGSSNWYERNLIWKKGEATVELNMIWAERKALGTYKIRCKVYWN